MGASRGEPGLLALTREVTVTRTGRFVQVPLQEPSATIQSSLSRFIAWPLRAVMPAKPAAGQRAHDPSTSQNRSEIHA